MTDQPHRPTPEDPNSRGGEFIGQGPPPTTPPEPVRGQPMTPRDRHEHDDLGFPHGDPDAPTVEMPTPPTPDATQAPDANAGILSRARSKAAASGIGGSALRLGAKITNNARSLGEGVADHVDDIVNPNSPELNRLRAARMESANIVEQEMYKYKEALARVHTVIDALSAVSQPEIETTIEVMKPIFPGHIWLANLALKKRRGVNAAQYSSGGDLDYNKYLTYYRKKEATKGWVLPFVYGGDEIHSKKLNHNPNRDFDLIIAGDGTHRSWMGGLVAYDGEPPVDGETIRTIGTGGDVLEAGLFTKIGHMLGYDISSRHHAYTQGLTTGPYGDRAIEGWTNPDKPEGGAINIDQDTVKLVKIANKLIDLGEDYGIRTRLDETLYPENFQRPPEAS